MLLLCRSKPAKPEDEQAENFIDLMIQTCTQNNLSDELFLKVLAKMEGITKENFHLMVVLGLFNV